MSADGTWKITLSTPMGPQTTTTTFTTQGESFTGRTESPMGAQDIAGKVDGDTLSWSADITTPIKLSLEFTASVARDKLTGTCKMGAFGNAPLTGERV